MKFWCATAFMNTTELVHIAQLLDQAGYHGLMISDHLAYPRDLQSKYPYSPHPDGRPIWAPETSWPDPWVLIGAMSSVTTQLNFTTNIYIAGHRPILQVAKEVATAAVLSEGRVALGVGAGWMKEEFDLQGQDFSNRGKRLNEMIPALRELWKGGWVEWHGEHYDFEYRIDAILVEDIGAIGRQHQERWMCHVRHIQQAERNGQANADGCVEATEQQTEHDGIEQQLE